MTMDLKKLISRESDKIHEVMKRDIEDIAAVCDPLLVEILEYALLGGGKRVRPLLVILSGRISGRDDSDLYRLAAAFEYLHVATLLHDDVIDQADIRRGVTSVYRKYGLVGAILAGDYLHACSMEIVGRLGGSDSLKIFTNATRGMADGEFVQLRNSTNFVQSEADYFSVIMGKTALLIGAACEIGGVFGGAETEERKALKAYGIKLGCAFQIIDDILDYQGQTEKTGKAVGNDLSEGKMTLPLIMAMDRADLEDRNHILAILQDDGKRVEQFAEVFDFINICDGFTAAMSRAESIIKEALDAITQLKTIANSDSIDILHGLAHYVLDRKK